MADVGMDPGSEVRRAGAFLSRFAERGERRSRLRLLTRFSDEVHRLYGVMKFLGLHKKDWLAVANTPSRYDPLSVGVGLQAAPDSIPTNFRNVKRWDGGDGSASRREEGHGAPLLLSRSKTPRRFADAEKKSAAPSSLPTSARRKFRRVGRAFLTHALRSSTFPVQPGGAKRQRSAGGRYDSFMPVAASSSAMACGPDSTLIVVMPIARAGFRFGPRSSRNTQADGDTPSISHIIV